MLESFDNSSKVKPINIFTGYFGKMRNVEIEFDHPEFNSEFNTKEVDIIIHKGILISSGNITNDSPRSNNRMLRHNTMSIPEFLSVSRIFVQNSDVFIQCHIVEPVELMNLCSKRIIFEKIFKYKITQNQKVIKVDSYVDFYPVFLIDENYVVDPPNIFEKF